MPLALQRAIGSLFVACIAAVGPFLLVLAVISVIRTESFIHTSNRADGSILELMRVHTNRGWTYAPVFRFTTQDGQTHILTSTIATAPPQFKVGDMIKVLYPTGHPESAKIDSFRQLFPFPLSAGIVGSALTIVTVSLYRRTRRQGKLAVPDAIANL